MTIVLKSYAKINLFLSVFQPRGDGFHPISSVFQQIDLYDELTISPLTSKNSLEISCDLPGCPVDGSNLLAKAYHGLATFLGRDLPGFQVAIHKRIPMGGGLGGGSSNAAAFLLHLNQACDLGLSIAELLRFSLRVGSDLPFFFTGGLAHVSGIGEQVFPLSEANPFPYFFLIFPPYSMSTPEVYKKLDEINPHLSPPILFDSDWISDVGHNDLLPAALALNPNFRLFWDKANQVLEGRLCLSGSGSTCFVPCQVEEDAKAIQALFSQHFPEIFTQLTRLF